LNKSRQGQALLRLFLLKEGTAENTVPDGEILAMLIDEVEAAVDGADQEHMSTPIMISSCLIIAGTISAQASL